LLASAGQAILHATVAALVVEALLRAWRVEAPGERLALRWVVIAAPLLLTPAYIGLLPFRSTAGFADGWALFAGRHWNDVRLFGAGCATLATLGLSALGTALYLRDAVPFLADRLARRETETVSPADEPPHARVRAALAGLAGEGPLRPLEVTVLDLESPVLLCSGIDRASILVSTGTLDRLGDDALMAALAHELAHLRARDPLMGWWLMAARTLQFFNPVVQIAARLAVQDVERRADVAVASQGRGAALASAVQRLSQAPDAHSDLTLPSEGGRLVSRTLSSAHRHAIDARCQLLIENVRPPRRTGRGWRVGLAAAAVSALLLLVV
jgi:Zn-dependent protease with chaperone function